VLADSKLLTNYFLNGQMIAERIDVCRVCKDSRQLVGNGLTLVVRGCDRGLVPQNPTGLGLMSLHRCLCRMQGAMHGDTVQPLRQRGVEGEGIAV